MSENMTSNIHVEENWLLLLARMKANNAKEKKLKFVTNQAGSEWAQLQNNVHFIDRT